MSPAPPPFFGLLDVLFPWPTPQLPLTNRYEEQPDRSQTQVGYGGSREGALAGPVADVLSLLQTCWLLWSLAGRLSLEPSNPNISAILEPAGRSATPRPARQSPQSHGSPPQSTNAIVIASLLSSVKSEIPKTPARCSSEAPRPQGHSRLGRRDLAWVAITRQTLLHSFGCHVICPEAAAIASVERWQGLAGVLPDDGARSDILRAPSLR